MDEANSLVISLMLAVPDATAAAAWYRDALGAEELWNLGSVVGLHIDARPIFLASRQRTDGNVPPHSARRQSEWRCSSTIRMASSPVQCRPVRMANGEMCGFTRCRGVRIARVVLSTRSATVARRRQVAAAAAPLADRHISD
jgi:hypothetical protein